MLCDTMLLLEQTNLAITTISALYTSSLLLPAFSVALVCEDALDPSEAQH